MKTLFSLFISLVITLSLSAQENAYFLEMEKYRVKENADFRNPEKSPLNDRERAEFEGHDFYPIDSAYRIIADFVATPDVKPFPLPTSNGKTKTYKKLGDLNFYLKGMALSLEVYREIKRFPPPDEKVYLFLPIMDKTTGETTYGAGRYMHYEGIPEGTKWVVDFNKAYNPYCAYSDNYSCPIVPQANHLPIAIEAGVKGYKKK